MSKVTVLEGVERETLAIGEKLMVVRFTFQKDTEVPWHTHEHEQSSYIVQGKLKLILIKEQSEEDVILEQGMSSTIPPNIKHRAIALEDTIDINSFTPIREDYL